MNPVEAYKILKEHKTSQDRLIWEKIVGLFLANSFLFVALSMWKDNFTLLHYILPAIGIILCTGFAVSLIGDTRARLRSIKGLRLIEKKTDFNYLETKRSRPITDIDDEAIGYTKYPKRINLGFFWSILSMLLTVIWGFILWGFIPIGI